MKRIMFVLATLLGALGLQAGDSYLYWMIDGNDAMTKLNVSSLGGYTAKIYGVANDTPTLLTLYGTPGDASSAYDAVNAQAAQLAGVFAGLAQNAAYSSFYVEIWDAYNAIGTSQTLDLSSVQSYISTMEFSASAPTLVAKFGGFVPTPVPEPCSGLLMVFGLAAFALRRPRRA